MGNGTARTDDDSWNVAAGVGRTALLVALGRAVASRGDNPPLCDPFAEPLVIAAGVPELAPDAVIERSSDDPDFKKSLDFLVAMMTARTLAIDEAMQRANAKACRQVVILASGLDARAVRIAWNPGTTVFEVDQPDVIDFKKQVFADEGARSSAQWVPIAHDLRNDWVSPLRDGGFDAAVPTCWLAEGLLPYLRGDDQMRLLDTITSVSPPGSVLQVDPPVGGHVDPADFGIQAEGFGVTAGDLFLDTDDFDAHTWLDTHGWHTTSSPLMSWRSARETAGPTLDDRFMAMAAHLRILQANKN